MFLLGLMPLGCPCKASRFLHRYFGKRASRAVARGPICERRREIVIQLTISLQSHNVPCRSPRFGNIQPKSQG
jgi:hypothetical protein